MSFSPVSLLYLYTSQDLGGSDASSHPQESQTLEAEWIVYSEGGGVGAMVQVGSAANLWVGPGSTHSWE